MGNFNLKKKCNEAPEKEFFYGALTNHAIKDAYLGLCYLDPEEQNRIIGPPKGHEEILLVLEGKIEIKVKDEVIIIDEGEVFYLPDGQKAQVKNLTAQRLYFVIAGGHPQEASHHHHQH